VLEAKRKKLLGHTVARKRGGGERYDRKRTSAAKQKIYNTYQSYRERKANGIYATNILFLLKQKLADMRAA
jgi:hypothetical protein